MKADLLGSNGPAGPVPGLDRQRIAGKPGLDQAFDLLHGLSGGVYAIDGRVGEKRRFILSRFQEVISGPGRRQDGGPNDGCQSDPAGLFLPFRSVRPFPAPPPLTKAGWYSVTKELKIVSGWI